MRYVPPLPDRCPPASRLVPAILAMTLVVLASNILVQFPMGAWLTWGALTYPFAFLVADLTNRIHGAPAARRVVVAGFVTGILCSFAGSLIEGEAGALVTRRIALGSGLAYLCGQMTDVSIFTLLRGRSWWQAPLVSTLVSSTLDTALFFSIAFSATFVFLEPGNDVAWAGGATALLGFGPALPYWVSLAVADWSVKLALALVALVPFRLIVARYIARLA